MEAANGDLKSPTTTVAVNSKANRFRLFTRESLAKIAKRIQEDKLAKEQQKEKDQNEKDGEKKEEESPKPNPALQQGMPLPQKMSDFPPEMFGIPIEDIDEYYHNKYTFVVVAKDKTIFRFSSSNGFFLLSPWNPIRRAALLVLTHPMFSLLVMLVILVNCVFMAINTEIPHSELIFTIIYTVEGTVKMLARGFILADFTYLRDAWNWLDFIVVSSAYMTIVSKDSGGKMAVLRTFRVFRALKTVAVVPGLKTIVGALMEAVRRLRDVMILSLFVLSIFALIGLQLYQGRLMRKCIETPANLTEYYKLPKDERRAYAGNKSRWQNYPDNVDGKICGGSACGEGYTCLESGFNPNYNYTNFDNFGWALLCAFRLMTQDFWEDLYQLTLKANGPFHMFFFVIVIFLGSFYLVNLILAIVAMSYDDCRKQDADAEAQEEAELQEMMQQQEMEDAAAAALLAEEAAEEFQPKSPQSALSGHADGYQKGDGASLRSAGSSRKRSEVNNSAIDVKSMSSHPDSPSLALHRGSQFGWRFQPPIPPPSYPSQPFGNSSYQSPALSTGGPFVLPCLENLDLPFADDSAAVTPTSEDICAFQNARNAYLTSKTGVRSSMTLISAGSGMGLYQQQPNRMVQLETRFASSRQSSYVSTHPYVQSPKLLSTPTSLLAGEGPHGRMRLPDFRRTEPTHFHWVSGRGRNLNTNAIGGAGITVGKTKDDLDKNKLNDATFAYRTPSNTTIDMKDVLVLKDLIKEASKKKNIFGMEEGQSKKEFFKAKCHQLLFGWECCPCWYKFARVIELFIMDAFVDLFITLCIVINTLFMAMDHDKMSPQLESTLKYGNYVFTCIFTIEAVLKILALGLYKYLEDKWSCFDIVIVILSLVELGLSGVKGLSILRSFRLLRVFKLAKSWPTLNLLIGIIGRTMGALGNLCFVLAIIIFIFAVMGMQLFGPNYVAERFDGVLPGWHFCDFLHAFMIVFRVLCGEWIQSMWDCIHCSGPPCIPFFLLTMIIGNLVVLNLFLALLLSSFGAESLKHSEEDEGPNKLQEAIDRITRFCIYIKSHLYYRFKKPKHPLLVDGEIVTPHVVEQGGNGGLYQAYDCTSPTATGELTTVGNKVNHHPSCNHQQHHHHRQQSIKSGTSYDDGSSVVSSSTSSTEGDGEKSMMSRFSYSYDDVTSTARTVEGPEIHEVKVVFIKYPDECCPKCCVNKCGFIFDAFDRTTVGKIWGGYRFFMFKLVENNYFETFIILMILMSSLALAVEDVYIENPERWILKMILKVMDKVFTVIFVIEMVIKQSAYGFKKYFTDAWCWLDFVIVTISLLSLGAESAGYGNIGAFRALRTLRALRPLRAVSRWEGMKVVVNALIQAIPSIFNVLLVCLVFWLIFSIMGVNLFGGKFYECQDSNGIRLNISIVPNKTVCEQMEKTHNYTWFNPKINFDHVPVGYLALFQVATFKGWTEIMNSAINSQSEPEAQPVFEVRSGMYLYFVFFIVFGSFFTLNLFIGVIIENFNVQKKKAGGSLEMLMTADQKKYYNAMKKLGSKQPQKPIPKPKMKCQLVLFYITSSQKFDIFIMIFILLNMMTMAIEHFDQSRELGHVLWWVNQFFVIIFTLECVMKLLSLRQYYFKQPWNIFDFVVVISSLLTAILSEELDDLPISPTLLRVVRVFRVGRILRLVKSAKGIRTLLFSLAVSMPALFNIGLLLFLVMFIYSIFGMSFFMHVKHTKGLDDMFNFETFFRSMIILFQISTSAGWDGVLAGLMNEEDCDPNQTDIKPNGDCGSSGEAVVFLVTYLVISFLVVINMYIAVILENFSQATEDVQQGLTQDDFDMYYEIWERFDENATQYINLTELSRFTDELEDPLRLPLPNHFKLVSLDIPICENDRVHCVDILDALTKNYLGTVETDDLTDIKKGPERKNYHPISSMLKRQREIYAAKVIQDAWRKYYRRKHGKDFYDGDQAPPFSLPPPIIEVPVAYGLAQVPPDEAEEEQGIDLIDI